MDKKTVLKLSVRNLVEFILREGDIDNRRSGSDKDAMQAGTRLHKKIQKSMGAAYRAEVSLKHEIELEDYIICLEGRADGILVEENNVTVDEIKGIYADLFYLEAPHMVHKAQAMCYGYIYGIQNQLSEITIQMTYGNLETEELKRFQELMDMEELGEWFQGLIREYIKWADFLFHKRIKRKASIKNLEFPFSYREGQKEMAVGVYRTISRNKTIFVQAPTGIGKTMAAVFPSVKAVGEELGDKIFYLTAKTITRTVAEDSFRVLRKKGLLFSTVTITAKEKLCFLEESECNPDACPYAKGHYDRVNEAVFDLIHEQEAISREVIEEYGKKYGVCPFELCLDTTNWTDGIICDYNYVFDPRVKLKRYFAEGVSGDYIFLVDEAHNLVTRAREMFSAHLYKEEFLEAKKLVGGRNPKLTRFLEQCNKALLTMKRECDRYRILDSISHFIMLLNDLYEEMELFFENFKELEGKKQLLEFYFKVWNFIQIYERVDENYRIYTEHKDNRFMLKLFCINPSVNLKESLDRGRAAVLFSATFLPIRYYRELLRGKEEDYAIYVDSPFDPKRRLLCIARDVSSKYTRRNRSEYERIISYITSLAQAKKGNYIVFFPSYAFMEAVGSILEGRQPEFELRKQENQMSESVREEFLKEFEKERDSSFVALCVMGGIFSEGIDLTHDKLIGTIIVGTGLPMIDTDGEILKEYYDENGQNGFHFAYLYPGLNKVLQSAGRVIRTAEDRGVILLLDDRFFNQEYRELFPKEWFDCRPVSRFELPGLLEQFWSREATADQ